MQPVTIGDQPVGLPGRPVLVAGLCVLEGTRLAVDVARESSRLAALHGFGYVFKASFDKANRTSVSSFRGPGLEKGLQMLAAVKRELGVPVLTDIHEPFQAEAAAGVADALQIPAFLCRQTDLVCAAARTGRPVNIKKGQFMAPRDMAMVVEKARSAGGESILLTERGTFFGYGRLVVDMTGLALMRSLGHPVLFDATHSVQQPAALGDRSGGDRQGALVLARAAAAAGCDGLFVEVHPEPEKAPSDAATALDFTLLDRLLGETAPIFSLCAAHIEGQP